MEKQEEVHLGVFCLHMSSDSEREIECLGSQVADKNGRKTSSPPVNYQGVAARTRRAKDKMNGLVNIQSGYRCSCCEVDTSKEKHRKYLNKGSSVSKVLVEGESIPVDDRSVVEDGQVADQAIADPGSSLGGDLKFSPKVWKPSDEIELASAVLNGINSGLEGVSSGADVISANLHSRFWEKIRKKMRKKSGDVRSKRQIADKFRKMRNSYLVNAMRQGSVVRSRGGHKEELFGILQQIFVDRTKEGMSANDNSLTPLEGEVYGNEDQVAQPRAMDNIIGQKASPGVEVPRNGISFTLCLPSPNQPLILKHVSRNYTAKTLRGEKQPLQFSPMTRSKKRKLQDEIVVDAQNSENNQSPLISPRRKLTKTSEDNPSFLDSPKRKSAKRASIAAVISKESRSSERTKSAKRTSQNEHTIPVEMSKDSPASHTSLKMKVVDEARFQNEIASVSQSKDTTSSQFLLKTKYKRWSSQDEMAIATSVLDAIKSGLLGEKLGPDVEWRQQSKLWQEVHRQVQRTTGKEFSIDQIYYKFMKLRMKFLNIGKKLYGKRKIQLSDHEKQLLKTFQGILLPKQRRSTALSKKESRKSEASQDLHPSRSQMNDSECFESVPLQLAGNEAPEKQHGQMEISTARVEQDGLMDMKDVADKCKELPEESRAICKEIWQNCEQKFLEMQSQLTEMLERKMQDLKESQSVKGTSLSETGLFLGESSGDGEGGNSRMHLEMESHLKHRSRKLQLMQELCRIEKEELETQYLASKFKGLISNVVK